MKKRKMMATMMAVVMLVMSLSSMMVYGANPIEETARVTIQNDTSSTAVSINGIAFSLYKVFDLTIVDADADQDISESITYSVNDSFTDFFDGVLENDLAAYLAGDVATYADEDAARLAYDQAALDYVNDCKVFDDNGNVVTNTMAELVAALRLYILDETTTIEPETTTGTTATNTNGVEVITSDEVDYGYYLILDSDSTATEDGIVPAGSLVTVPGIATDGTMSADVTVVMKGSIPSMNKEVWHNDIDNVNSDYSPTYGTSGSWDIVADYQIGDTIEYRITATIPSDLRGYSSDTYTYIISDTLSEGIEIVKDSVQIYTSSTLSAATLVEGGYHSIEYGTQEGEATFTIDFDMYGIVNDLALDGIEVFYVYYKAIVTEDALIATDYETNTAELTYSNNPYDIESFGEVEDTVYSYTFDVDILKTSGDGVTPLADAVFALYEISGEVPNQTITQVYLALDTDTADYETEAQVYYPVNQAASSTMGIITTNESGEFNIVGLDDSTTYMLKELEAPDGYNAIDPITFAIQVSYSEVNGVLVPSISTTSTEFKADDSGLYATIINTSNQLLPGTGGIGTTIFTMVGGCFMLGAAILFIGKRRMAR